MPLKKDLPDTYRSRITSTFFTFKGSYENILSGSVNATPSSNTSEWLSKKFMCNRVKDLEIQFSPANSHSDFHHVFPEYFFHRVKPDRKSTRLNSSNSQTS